MSADDCHAPHSLRRAALEPAARFEMLARLNDPALSSLAGKPGRIDARAQLLFDGESVVERFVRELAARRALRAKELCESLELFQRARRTVRAPVVADLCCGHGLVGICFALFERQVERVLLIDQRLPDNHAACLEAACAVGPWVREKIEFHTLRLQQARALLPQGVGIAAVHACGQKTDRVLELALERGSGLALVPCCYRDTGSAAPEALREKLGVENAADVERTYRLERAGWKVRWCALPTQITPMNRVILAKPR